MIGPEIIDRVEAVINAHVPVLLASEVSRPLAHAVVATVLDASREPSEGMIDEGYTAYYNSAGETVQIAIADVWCAMLGVLRKEMSLPLGTI